MGLIMYNDQPYSGGGSGGASSITDLTDTDISSPTNGQVLTYDDTSQKWKNTTEISNKNIVGTTDPSSSAGNENDVYYKTSSYTPSHYTFTKLKMTITADKSSDGYTQLSRVDIVKTDDSLYSWSGTTVSANCSYSNTEHPNNLIDGSTLTKFCGAISPSPSSPLVLTFNLGTSIVSSELKQWKWYTANDTPGRDPITFTLSVSSDGINWIDLDVATSASITTNRNALAYTGNIDDPAPEEYTIEKKYVKIEGQWIEDNVGGGGASTVSDLTDVELTDLADGEILKYDATEEKWVNAEDGGGGAEAIELTWDEYEALSSEEKLDEKKVYYISDYGTGSGARTIKVESYVSSVTTSQYGWIAGVKDKFGNNLTKNDQILGIDVMTADATNYPSFLWTLVGVSWYAKAINLNNFQAIQSAITFKIRITYIKNISSEA